MTKINFGACQLVFFDSFFSTSAYKCAVLHISLSGVTKRELLYVHSN